MTHGAPDNYQVNPRPTTFTLQDDAELAERLGATPSLDRLGNVIFIDEFEDGLNKWNTEVDAATTIIDESGKWSMHGGWSVKINIPADADAYAKMYRALPYPTLSKIGLESNGTSDEHLSELISYLTFYTGSHKVTYGIKADIPGGNIYYLNEYNLWTLFLSGVSIYYASGIFHRGKFIADLPNLRYDRYSIATGTWSLKDKKPYVWPDYTLAHMYLEAYAKGSASGIIEVYLDSFIITQNEP
ncbi:hypothetical protein ES708_17603 [subsurface metagenome]